MRAITVGPVLGLRTTLLPLFWPSYLALAVLAGFLSYTLVHLTFALAAVAGVLSALIFLVCEHLPHLQGKCGWLHQFGHSLAARSMGHPMIGIRFFNLFSASEYPAHGAPLPALSHVRRALGGFWINVLIGLLCLPLALELWPHGREILPPATGLVAWLAGFGMVVNLVGLGLGALLPLKIPGGGLNDGGTLLKYWLEAQAKPKES